MSQPFTPKPARTLSLVCALVLAVMPFHALLSTWAISNFGHSDLFKIWKDILIVASLPLAVIVVAKSLDVRRWLVRSWVVRLYLAYILVHLIVGAWALHAHRVNGLALEYALVINLQFVGFFIVCGVAAASDELLKRNWARIVGLPAAIVVAFGLAQHFVLSDGFLRHFGYSNQTIPPYQSVDANQRYVRVQSTLRGANPLGAYLVVAIPAGLAYFKSRYARLVWLAASVVVIFYSYSRSAWVGTALALAIIIWLSVTRIKKIWVVGAIVLILVAGGLYGLRSSQTVQDIFLHTSNHSASATSSNQVRDSALRSGLHDVIHQPLGRGPGTAGPASFRNTGHTSRIAENYYLQLAQEVGVIGLAIFVAMNLLVGWQLWQMRSDRLAVILLASLVGISFINLLSHAWSDDTLSLIWWGLAGVATAESISKSSTIK